MAVILREFRTQNGSFVAEWGSISASDTGEPWGLAGQTDKTVTIAGAGGSFALEGSNNGSTWYTLHAINATFPAITADGIWLILENPLFIRPSGEATEVVITAR